jgi:hypothetical protein
VQSSLELSNPRLVVAFCFSALLATACGDSEGGSGGSSGDGGGGSTTSSGQGGAAPEACGGDELDDCLLRCDGLNSCSDAATQQACRDHCGVSTPKACVDFDACYVQDFSCENSLDCWGVFSGTTPAGEGGGTTTSGGGTSCSTACANVTAQCGDDGAIDFETCMDQCPSYSQAAIDCAADAQDCDAVLACIGAGG